jgi:hypothetical protein
LDLLKEIAGTSVYESKRQESMKIMEETSESRAKPIYCPQIRLIPNLLVSRFQTNQDHGPPREDRGKIKGA